MKYLKYFEDKIPGNSLAFNQLHVFDFDDTLGITKNANGVMYFKWGQPQHKSPEEVLDWLSKYDITSSNLLNGPNGKKIEYIENLGGFCAYIDSTKLAVLTGNPDFNNKESRWTPQTSLEKNGKLSPPDTVENALLIDFTPSGHVDLQTTKPVIPVINKLRDVESGGADTVVLTARQPDGVGINFRGEQVPITNAKDIEQFLRMNHVDSKRKPVDVVTGVTGGPKGEVIKKNIDTTFRDFLSKEKSDKLFKYYGMYDVIKGKINMMGEWPDEIHFYDDAPQNTDNVEKELAGKVPSEVHIYGPGDFHGGSINPYVPTKSFDKK